MEDPKVPAKKKIIRRKKTDLSRLTKGAQTARKRRKLMPLEKRMELNKKYYEAKRSRLRNETPEERASRLQRGLTYQREIRKRKSEKERYLARKQERDKIHEAQTMSKRSYKKKTSQNSKKNGNERQSIQTLVKVKIEMNYSDDDDDDPLSIKRVPLEICTDVIE